MTQIKICGITNHKDAYAAYGLKVDYIGFVFFENSERYIKPETAKGISHALKSIKKVGLFVNKDPEEVREISDFVGLDIIQLHGYEDTEYCRRFQDKEVWKAIRVKDEESLDAIPAYDSIKGIVLDTHVKGKIGGTGKNFDWNLAVKAKEFGKNIILAGGLYPSNVAEAIEIVNPYAVDVSSGVEESKGIKSYEKMKEFIENVRNPISLIKDKR